VSQILLYDEDEIDLRTARRQLELHGVERADIAEHENRIDLLEAIDRQDEVLVALIDLQSDDRADNSYSGHRIIEAIRRHSRLHARCRPLAYTQHARPDVIDLARRHGAYALISKLDLEVKPDSVDLLGFLASQRSSAAREPDPDDSDPHAFPVFPSTERARERAERYRARETAALESVLIRPPRLVRRPYFWDIVRYLAEDLDATSCCQCKPPLRASTSPPTTG